MSNIISSKNKRDQNDIDKENEIKEENQKGKDKDTNKLLEEISSSNEENYNNKYDNKNNEIFCFYFILLAAFIYIVYSVTKINKIHDKNSIIQNGFFSSEKSVDTNSNIENNKFNELLPSISLGQKNEFPNLKAIFNSRILYIDKKNLTNRYLHYIRQIQSEEEEQFEKELYNNTIPNDSFSENRVNYIDTEKFIELCNQEKLINNEKIIVSDQPLISIIIPCFNKKKLIMRTIRSIQNQSFKNLEIILVDDLSTENATDLYNSLLQSEPRIRVFYHIKNMGLFRSRLNGFLYSRGKYILHFDAGDFLSDNYVLEDLYNMVVKYSLDSIRFSFKKYEKKEDNTFKVKTISYPKELLKISYGFVKQNIHTYEYGTIWNRLTRANIFLKGIDIVDWHILNAYKNLWENKWWNALANYVSFSYFFSNRLGYIHYSDHIEHNHKIKISTKEEKDKTIREFIYFWLLDYQLLPLDNPKTIIIKKLRKYNLDNGTYFGTPLNLNYLTTNFSEYPHLLKVLIDDPMVDDLDRPFLYELLINYSNKFNITISNIPNYNTSSNISNITINGNVNNHIL